MLLKAFWRDSLVYAIPAIVSRGLAFFLVPIYTRVLRPADYGAFDLLMVFVSIVNLTVALEVSQGLARFYTITEEADRKVAYASSAFWFTVVCYGLFGLVAFGCSSRLSMWVMGSEGMGTAFRLGILYVCCNGIFYLIQNQFRWELRSRHYAVVSLLVTLATAVAAVELAYGLGWGLEGLLGGMVIGTIPGIVYGLWHLRQSFRLRFQPACLREMLKFSAPLVPSGVAVFISTYIDRLMINYHLSVEAVGIYGIGFRLASVVGLVMVGFQGALTPLVYTYHRQADTPGEMARIFRYFVAFALLLFLVITLFAHDILVLWTTSAFYGGAAVVVFLVPAILLSQMYIFAPGVFIAGKTHLVWWINLSGAILNTTFNALLIPGLGIQGAALATLMGYLAVFGGYMALSQRFYPVPHAWGRLALAVALAGALAVAVPWAARETLSRWVFSGLALAIMAGAIIALGLISGDEIRHLGRTLRGRYHAARTHARR
jgi:O-antigen/teichoic acid export membrane protein